MADESLPYKVEYAKSGRASCKGCKEGISKDSLRLAAMVQSPMFDGKVPNWYHYKCFFTKQRPQSPADIENFDAIKYEDQEKIRTKLEAALALPAPKGRGGKGKGKGAAAAGKGEFAEFAIEVAAAGRAGCQGCQQKVLKGEVRVGKMDYTSDSARRYGPMRRWNHVSCFLELRDSLQFYGGAKDLPGFYALPAPMQDSVAADVKPIKRKAEDVVDGPPEPKKPKKADEDLLKRQSKAIYKFRDELKALSKTDLTRLMQRNVKDFEELGHGESRLLDLCSDLLTFGATEPCSQCGGMFVFKSGQGYACEGYISEYTRCVNVEKVPKRRPAEIPKGLAKEFAFLGKYKQPALGDRVFIDRGPSMAAIQAAKPKTAPPNTRPLAGLAFVVALGDAAAVTEAVTALGGIVRARVEASTAAVITDEETLNAGGKVVKKAEAKGVQCVAKDFLDEVKKCEAGGALRLIRSKAISDWGEDVEKRVSSSKLYKSVKSVSTKSKFEKSMPDKMKVTLKNGGAVDPDSEMADSAHVLRHGGRLYSVVMGAADVTRGTNSYYRLQLLASDRGAAWWLWRAWGRIGTTIGGNKLEEMDGLHDGLRRFHDLFQEKSGNNFKSEKYEKKAGFMSVLDVDYGESNKENIQKMVVSKENSSLPVNVQELIALIFDIDNMKSQMMEFEIDMKKMPLGKLSQSQLTAAFKVLADAQNLLEEDNKSIGPRLLDCSNKFYSLIPHDFGMDRVPLLDSLDAIRTKIEMIESLKEIELAYNMMSGGTEEGKSVIDSHYAKLNTTIEPLAHDSHEMSVIRDYVANTHAATHAHYTLKLLDVFKVSRAGEAKRFKPFKKLHNRQLLWHGSRLTNFVGILSQGLRIAPPEAPVTGYMFGKGVYFADMVSKSANYCCASTNSPTGVLLLCDVALGDTYERTQAEYVKKLEPGKHSTKGVGRTRPASSVTLDGVTVPTGKPETVDVQSSLLYNEYVVYDTAQVNIKYLLKVKFEYV